MSNIVTKLQAIFADVEDVTEGTIKVGFPVAANAILATNLKANQTPREFFDRTFAGAMGTRSGKIGAIPMAGIAFDTELYGNGTTTVPQVSPLLKSVFGKLNTDSIDTVATGGTSTSITLAATAGATVGNGLLVETAADSNVYELTFITAIVANTSIAVSPALSFSPANNAHLKFTTTYQVQDTGHPSVSIYNYLTGGSGSAQVLQNVGARGNLKIASKKAGTIPVLSWDFKAWNWAQATNGTLPVANYGSGIPPVALSTIFKLGGTQTDIQDLELDLGNVVTPLLSQNSSLGVYKMPVTDRKTVGKFRIHADAASVAPFTSWTSNTVTTISQQFGNTRFGTWGYYVPNAERKAVAYGDDGGITTNDVSFNANISAGQDALYIAVG